MSSGPRCLYYGLGGGLGHGVRCLALARRMANELGGRHVVLVNTPFTGTLARIAASSPVAIERLAPTAAPSEAGRWFTRQCDEFQPDIVVVDTFPRGLGGELADWLPSWRRGLRVLTSRTLPASYCRQFSIVPFVRGSYDLVLAPGESNPVADALPAVVTGAWMVRGRDELCSPQIAAERLNMLAHQRCVLVVGTGTIDECHSWSDWFVRLNRVWPADGPPLRFALPLEVDPSQPIPGHQMVRHAPLVEWLPGASLVVGNAGFHLVHECRWLGLPARFIPRPRLYDRQEIRLSSDERADWNGVPGPDELIEWATRAHGATPESDGVADAVAAIRIANG